jgi:hypothetical protein
MGIVIRRRDPDRISQMDHGKPKISAFDGGLGIGDQPLCLGGIFLHRRVGLWTGGQCGFGSDQETAHGGPQQKPGPCLANGAVVHAISEMANLPAVLRMLGENAGLH